jgi:hypothetical protein
VSSKRKTKENKYLIIFFRKKFVYLFAWLLLLLFLDQWLLDGLALKDSVS